MFTLGIQKISDCTEPEFFERLKVHTNENFFGFNFEICTVSLLVMIKYEGFVKIFFDWAMNGGVTIVALSLRLRGIEFSLV
jgi:hypothetical protein